MSESTGKFVAGALIGAAAGAIAGILLAPKSGKETRADITIKAKEYTATGKEMVVQGKKVVKGAIHDTAEKVAKKTS